MSITIRQATAEDKDFLIEAIMEAEKSGSDTISYCAIFSITEDQLRETLSNMLDEEMEDQELYIPNFLVAEVDGKPAATISGWVEKKNGMASSIIKSNMLMYSLDRDILLAAAPRLGLMNEVSITRDENALQLECVYTKPEFRGRGLAACLLEAHIKRMKDEGEPVDTAQIILLKNNTGAIKAYEKAGFSIVAEKTCGDDGILRLLPGDTKIMMERKLN